MDGDIAVASRTVALDEESVERLARLSAEVGCTPEQVLQDALLALEHMLEEERTPPHIYSEEDDAAMRQAIADFERGEGVPHEQVMAEAREIIGERELPFTPEQVVQIERGLQAMREGLVKPSSEVFARLEAKYGG